ncbi:MAG: hypothetical protein MJK12_19770 [Colwellia sp.]|nr:hypothetical protein [Colwellia sp.]
MSDWLIIGIIVVVFMVIIGNLSTLQKNAKTPLRKKSLNDLKETLPRSHKTDHKLPTVKQKNSD